MIIYLCIFILLPTTNFALNVVENHPLHQEVHSLGPVNGPVNEISSKTSFSNSNAHFNEHQGIPSIVIHEADDKVPWNSVGVQNPNFLKVPDSPNKAGVQKFYSAKAKEWLKLDMQGKREAIYYDKGLLNYLLKNNVASVDKLLFSEFKFINLYQKRVANDLKVMAEDSQAYEESKSIVWRAIYDKASLGRPLTSEEVNVIHTIYSIEQKKGTLKRTTNGKLVVPLTINGKFYESPPLYENGDGLEFKYSPGKNFRFQDVVNAIGRGQTFASPFAFVTWVETLPPSQIAFLKTVINDKALEVKFGSDFVNSYKDVMTHVENEQK